MQRTAWRPVPFPLAPIVWGALLAPGGCEADLEREEALAFDTSSAMDVTRHGPPSPGECDPSRSPSSPSQCCEDGNQQFYRGHATFLGTEWSVLLRRTKGEPCREADGIGTNCGADVGVPCAYGPCGARAEWALWTLSGGDCPAEDPDCRVQVFHPESDPRKCGWEVRDIELCDDALHPHPAPGFPIKYDTEMCDDADGWLGGDRAWPEEYVGQVSYPGYTSECSYRRCLSGGIPMP